MPSKAAPVGALLRDDRALAGWIEQRQPEMQAAAARLAQARAEVGAARVFLPNPEIDAAVGGVTLGGTNPARSPYHPGGLTFGETGNVSVGLSQTIELGKRGPRVEAAELRARGARVLYAATAADRVADTRMVLARAVYLKARVALLEDTLASARRVADLEKARVEHGAMSGNDYDRLLLDTLTLEADVARSRAELAGALSACQAAMLSPCEVEGAQIGDVDAAAPLPSTLDPAEIGRRPDVEAARLEGAAAEQDAVLARRKAIPDPTVRIGYTHDNNVIGGSQPNTLQFSVTVPLPLFDHGQHDAAKAMARASEQRHLATALVVNGEGSLSALLGRRAYLESALRTLSTTAVPKSAGVLDATSKAFNQGQVSLTDLLLARRTHVSLVLSQMDMRFDFFSVRNDLRRVLGLDAQASATRQTP